MNNAVKSSGYSTVISLSVVALALASCSTTQTIVYPERPKGIVTVVYQPSHQTDTGTDFNEAAVCNGIVEGAIAARSGVLRESKVWSHDVSGLRYARQGSNTVIDHTSAVVGDSLTGYGWELRESNNRAPFVFVSVHNNGGTNQNAIWGFIHEGDEYEAANRELAAELVTAVADATGLIDKGVLFDSSTGRNNYRCRTTGKLSFFSLDENVNHAPYRVLLEIGDNAVSRDFLQSPENQKNMGEVIQRVLEGRFGKRSDDR